MNELSITDIKLSDYTYELPDERIAKFPLSERDQSKLQVYNQGEITHTQFYQIADYLPEGSLLVFNNTKVIPARIHFQKPTGATIQIFLLHPIAPTAVINLAMEVSDSCIWECMIGNKKRFKKNDILQRTLQVNGQEVLVSAKLADEENNHVELSWQNLSNDAPILFVDLIQSLGEIPLPPYLNRASEESDKQNYQTIYAKEEGAVAAPTAGLHFSKHLLKRLEIKGIDFAEVTLHVGLGTFNPVEVEDLSKHKMDSEELKITQEACDIVNKAKANKKRICCIGTTSMRAIESSVSSAKTLNPYDGWTNKFIFPPYDFSIANAMVTNFHTPESTLLMMVAAFGDYDYVMNAYEQAVKEKYRFYSYGDAMLII